MDRNSALSWFASRVKRGENEIFAEMTDMFEEKIKLILEYNLDNRNRNDTEINQIARDINRDHWEENGEPVIISKEGWLNDGQNRLLGMLKSGKVVRCLVVFGVTRKSRLTVDMGRARTTNQYLKMEGVTYANECAAVAGQWLGYSLGIYGKPTKTGTGLTKQDIMGFYHDHKDKIDAAAHKIGPDPNIKALGRGGKSAMITAYVILSEEPNIDTFFHKLLGGSELAEDDPILWLRNRLLTATLTSSGRIETILRYWLKWKDGVKLKKNLPLLGEWPDMGKGRRR